MLAHRMMMAASRRGYTLLTPTAVNTSFTYTSGGAAQAHLYDGNISTVAADPASLNVNTHIAYDFGTPRAVRRLISYTSGGGTGQNWSETDVFNIQYSDAGLTTGWTTVSGAVTQHTISEDSPGVQNIETSDIDANGAHRYWRIIYASGPLEGNAWLGEFQMYDIS